MGATGMKSMTRRKALTVAASGAVAAGTSVANAQGQEEQQMLGSSGLLPEKTGKVEHLLQSEVRMAAAAVGTQFAGSCTVGPSNSDVIFKCTGWNFKSSYPPQVFLQARQNSNQNLDFGWTDQFCLQVIETARDFVRFRVRRMDDGTSSSGWGQNLRVDIFVIDF